nr:phenylacetate--CoA ligase family protein [Thermoanaerobaculia bacterium]
MRREAAAGALERLPALVAQLLDANPFYQRKYRDLPALRGLSPEALLARLPFLTKAELVADQQGHPPFGSNRTVPLERFTRLHRTSGTSGQPLYWLDTPETWAW